MRRILHIASRPALAMMAVILMACQCGGPVPPTPPNPPQPPVDTRSESLKAFLNNTDIGLYVDSEGIIIYDDLYYQKAWSTEEGSFRIQRDDQSAFLSIRSSSQSASSSYQVEYMTGDQNVTLVFLKLQNVQSDGSCIWLWNETMKTGIVIPEGIL